MYLSVAEAVILRVHWMQTLDTGFICGRDRQPGVSLGSGKQILGEMGSTSGIYRLIPTVCVFTAPQSVAMEVGNDGASVRNVIPDLRNDCVGF